jgi:hypothetical protein
VPFKAQNVSNNQRVALGGEMGSAQWLQAKAVRREAEVRFNPILLEPERDTASQVVVLGQVDQDLSEVEWRRRSPRLWERARPALHALIADNNVVVIEGAGSPAEINLADVDYVNLETARESNALSAHFRYRPGWHLRPSPRRMVASARGSAAAPGAVTADLSPAKGDVVSLGRSSGPNESTMSIAQQDNEERKLA